jgi:Golgi phosphoprotein 3
MINARPIWLKPALLAVALPLLAMTVSACATLTAEQDQVAITGLLQDRKAETVPKGDEALAEICTEPASQPTRFWLSRLSRSGPVLTERIERSLVNQGVLRLVETRLLWVLKSRTYPPASGIEQREVRQRILTLLDNTEIPDPRDALLVGLLRASGLVDRLLDEPELSRLRARIDQISNLEEISRELTWTVQELRVLLSAMTELEAEQ